MTTVDVEWDDETRGAAMALGLYEDSLCPLCGRPSHICHDINRQFDWHAPAPTRCHAYTALLAAQAGFTEETHPQSGALLFSVGLRDEVTTP